MFAVADEDYDEIEVDLPPSGGESRVAPYAIDIVQSEALSSEAVCIAQVGEIGGSSSKHRVLPRGERCGRCFRRRCIRYDMVQYIISAHDTFIICLYAAILAAR